MDHFKVTKNDINLLEIKVEDHPIKIEPEYYQEPLIDNNFQVRRVEIESDFAKLLKRNSSVIIVARILQGIITY